jgi:hypothetical protein
MTAFWLNNWPYSLIVLALTFADAASTIYALKRFPGRLRESNSIVAALHAKVGIVAGSLALKLPFVPIAFIPGIPWPALAALGLGHLVIVVANVKKIRQVSAA